MRNKLLAGILLLGFICALPGSGWARGGYGGQAGRGYGPAMGGQTGGPGMRQDNFNYGNQNGQSMGNNMSGRDYQNGPPCPPPGGGQYSQGQGAMMRPSRGPNGQRMGPPPQQMGYGGNGNGGDAYIQGPREGGAGMGPPGGQRNERPMGPPPGDNYSGNGNWNSPNDGNQPGNTQGQN